MSDHLHVIPVNDLREHEQSPRCHCRPRVVESGQIYIHNSYDRREADERVTTTNQRPTADQ